MKYDYKILLKTDRFVLIKHITIDGKSVKNQYSFGTVKDFESWKNNKGGFPISEYYITAEEMICRMEAWKKIDIKYSDVNNTYETEQKVIEILKEELKRQ